MSEKGHILSAFMEIKGVFNYTSFMAICEAVRQHGINPPLTSWILLILEWRKIHVLVDQKSIERLPVGRGSLASVMAPGNIHLVMAPREHKGLRTSICARSHRNNYRQVRRLSMEPLECKYACYPQLVLPHWTHTLGRLD